MEELSLPITMWHPLLHMKENKICKPGSVLDSHLSSPYVTIWLKPPIRGRRAVLTLKLGVAPDGVYIGQPCHHTCGKLLPHLFTLTFYKAVIFCCTFLKVSLTGRYPASLLCGARTFLVRCLSTLLYATV